MKRVFATLVSVAFVLSALNLVQTNAVASLNIVSPQAQRRASIRFVPRLIRQSNKKLRYTVKARYPQAVGAARDARLVKMNQALKSMATKEVGEFSKDFVAPDEVMGSSESYYDSDYIVSLAANDLVSIAWGVSTYYEGAAHPNHYTLAFNYDLKAGRTLSLADLFKPDSNYLKVMSDYTVKALMKKMSPDPDADWIQRGAGPEAENYKSWNIKREGLEITFDPYQVASYAEGEHVVVIPYNALKNVIDPNGALGRMTR